MKANVKGTVLEKYVRETVKDGIKSERLYVRLYQKGERVNLDVNVNANTYSQVKEGQDIVIENVSINAFKDNLYARQ